MSCTLDNPFIQIGSTVDVATSVTDLTGANVDDATCEFELIDGTGAVIVGPKAMAYVAGDQLYHGRLEASETETLTHNEAYKIKSTATRGADKGTKYETKTAIKG